MRTDRLQRLLVGGSGTATGVNASGDDFIIRTGGSDDVGLSIVAPDTKKPSIYFGDESAPDERFLQYRAADAVPHFGISHSVFVSEDANTSMTLGLTINQGANDDEIISLKSSDVAHGMTALTETDTYLKIKKNGSTSGQPLIQGYDDTNASAIQLSGIGSIDNTTKTTSGRAIIELWGAKKNGSTAQNPGTNANVLGVFDWSFNAKMLVDQEGEIHAVISPVNAFDHEWDAGILRTLEIAASPAAGIIRTEFDELVQYNEQALIDFGILGDTVENGGMWNINQNLRVLNGNAWQQETKYMSLVGRVDSLATELETATKKLAALTA
jgi:hypothetical protein